MFKHVAVLAFIAIGAVSAIPLDDEPVFDKTVDGVYRDIMKATEEEGLAVEDIVRAVVNEETDKLEESLKKLVENKKELVVLTIEASLKPVNQLIVYTMDPLREMHNDMRNRVARGIKDYDTEALFDNAFGVYEKYQQMKVKLIRLFAKTVYDLVIKALIKAEDMYQKWSDKRNKELLELTTLVPMPF